MSFPGGSVVKNPRASVGVFNPWVGKMPWSRKWQPTPVFLPGKFHGQRNLAGYRPWGRKESDMTEQLGTHTQISMIYCFVTKPCCIIILFIWVDNLGAQKLS